MYVTSTRKVISSYDVVFDQSFSSVLSYTSRPYLEAIAMRPIVTYTPYLFCPCVVRRATAHVETKTSSYDVVFDESFSSVLSYTSRPYSEAVAMRPAVTYNLYATSPKEKLAM